MIADKLQMAPLGHEVNISIEPFLGILQAPAWAFPSSSRSAVPCSPGTHAGEPSLRVR